MGLTHRVGGSQVERPYHGLDAVRDGFSNALILVGLLFLEGGLREGHDPLSGVGIFHRLDMPVEPQIEAHAEKMKVGDECDFHIFDVPLARLFIILLPLVGKQSGSELQNGVTIALESFIALPRRCDSTSGGGPVQVLWKDVVVVFRGCLSVELSTWDQHISRLDESL